MFIVLVINSLISIAYACSSGQYFNNSTGSCLSCSSNCISCLNGTTCSRCSQNYYISANRCNPCRSSGCTCNGLILNCSNSSNMSQIFLIVVVPLCVTIVIVILGCFISKKCRTVPVPTNSQNINQDFFMKIQPNLNNLGILSTVMKKKWVQNNSEDIIDKKSICAICLGDQCEILTMCKHTYHSKCLSVWVKHQSNCPVCKRENLLYVRKFCTNCHKNYIDTILKQINNFTQQLFNTCSSCKASKNRRLDSLCQMDLNQTQ